MPTDTSFLSEPIMEMDQEQNSMPESSESIAFLPDSNSIDQNTFSHYSSYAYLPSHASQAYLLSNPNGLRITSAPVPVGTSTILPSLFGNYTIRVVDPDVQENNICSFPKYDLAQYRFSGYHSSYDIASTTYVPIIFLSCPFPMKSSAFVETTKECWNNKSSGGRKAPQLYSYAKVGRLYASDLRISCRVELITMTSLRIQEKNVSSSLLEIHDALMYGFELFWFNAVCYQSCLFSHLCYLDNVKRVVKCNGAATLHEIMNGLGGVAKHLGCVIASCRKDKHQGRIGRSAGRRNQSDQPVIAPHAAALSQCCHCYHRITRIRDTHSAAPPAHV
nr:rust resistance kinase Lr10-like isoform X1 [Ipomoea batatas]